MLMNAGSPVSDYDGNLLTPVHYVAFLAQKSAGVDVVKMINSLYSSGADINQTTGRGDSALGIALVSEEPNLAFLSRLIELGANVNLPNHDGNTPLHIGAKYNISQDALLLLLDHGADPKVLNENHKLPIDLVNPSLASTKGEAYWRLHDARY